MVDGPEAALAEVEALERDQRLAGYRYLPATKADLLHRLGRDADADDAYQAALALSENAAEQEFLAARQLGAARRRPGQPLARASPPDGTPARGPEPRPQPAQPPVARGRIRAAA